MNIRKMLNRIVNDIESISIFKSHNIRRNQNKKLKKILNYSCENTEYYSNLFKTGNIDCNNLSTFPLMDKKKIIQNKDLLISKKKNKISYYDAYTGGSTGEPLHFFKQNNKIDAFCQIKYWLKLKYRIGDKILAMDGTSVEEEKLNKNVYWGKKSNFSLPYGKMFLSSLYINEKNIDYYVKFILKYKPQFIRGYPSFIYMIAKYIDENNIDIDFKIKAIQLTSETSFPYQWELISKVFNSKVCMQYGHTEACVFGYTFDNTMKYKIEPLYGYVEVIKEDGTIAKKGEIGEIVVTSYYNRIMPFIRYRTGDYALVGNSDDSTKIVFDKIMGRTQDYIYDLNGERVLLTALIFAQHFKALGNIQKWQIVQNKAGLVEMQIIKGKNYSDEDELELRNLFMEKGNVKIEFKYVNRIITTARGKSKLLVQNIK